MPARRGGRLVLAGIVGVAATAALVAAVVGLRGSRAPARAEVVFDARTPLPTLAEALGQSDARALGQLYTRLAAPDAPKPPALAEAEAPAWIAALDGLRQGYLKFGAYGRGTAQTVAAKVLDRFAIDIAPGAWARALPPARDIFGSGLADPDANVRATAQAEVGRLWSWRPGRTLLPAEEEVLADWKKGLHTQVVRGLADRDPKVRCAAVASLGLLPIDVLAEPAVAYLEDTTSADVRRQVLNSFARRRRLLSEEAVLKMMFDADPAVKLTADIVLKLRGLSAEQISLGTMIYHPKPAMRASVISLLRDRTDIDPVVWLLELSRDTDEAVRTGAVAALATRTTPEARQRLAEMAASDRAPAVRRAASRVLLPDASATAAIPPLPPGLPAGPRVTDGRVVRPGTPGLNPKAN